MANPSYKPHPTDDSLVIGDNGRVYAATRLPESSWEFRESWDVLDMLPDTALSQEYRLFLAGVIAGKLQAMAARILRDGRPS